MIWVYTNKLDLKFKDIVLFQTFSLPEQLTLTVHLLDVRIATTTPSTGDNHPQSCVVFPQSWPCAVRCIKVQCCVSQLAAWGTLPIHARCPNLLSGQLLSSVAAYQRQDLSRPTD